MGGRRSRALPPVLATVLLALLGAGAVAVGAARRDGGNGPSPAQLTAASKAVRHFEYVVDPGSISVYSIDQGNRLVHTISVPQIAGQARGVVASPKTGMLYVSYGGAGDYQGNGSLLALDLRTEQVVWQHAYQTGVDSMAITPDGKTIYLPTGEFSKGSTWSVVDAATGAVTGSIDAGTGPHNTIMGLDGRNVYLGAVDTPYLEVASTATNAVVRRIGPLHGPGVRPFTINGSQTLAFTTASSFLGFQVSSIRTGKVLYDVPIPGFSWNEQAFGGRTPDHGIALTPNERELYLIDTPNGYVHVFDVSGLPAKPPRDVADVKLVHAPPNDGWLQVSANGRYVYVGRSGDVIDTRTHRIVDHLPTVQNSADFLEIDWRHGQPVATTSRYGVGRRP